MTLPTLVAPSPQLTRIADLTALGVDELFLPRLAKTIGGTEDLPLTAFQSEVLRDSRLFSDANLLIAGPTSAGKTLIASVLAAVSRRNQTAQKILYVVPLRALVTEKGLEWGELFQEATVLRISSDYPRSDHFLRTGAWDISIVVFEKLYQWLADASLARMIVPHLGLVVLDELQSVGETERGEKLEIAITLLRHYQERHRDSHGKLPFRIVGMGVSREIVTGLQKWLDACVLPTQPVPRPVRLLESKVNPKYGQVVVYEEHSRALVDRSTAPAAVAALLEGAPGLFLLVQRAIGAGFRVLLYTAGRRDAVKTAQDLASKLPVNGIHPSIADELEQIEDSPVRDDLVKMLAARVGVHHGHMSPAERAIVENGFRSPDSDAPVQVLVATRTLGMGVNLPADVVVLKDLYTGQRSVQGAPEAALYRKLTVGEYRNFAGRAGRLRPGLPTDALGLVVLYDGGRRWRGVADELLAGAAVPVSSALNQPILGWTAHTVTALAFHDSFHRGTGALNRVSEVLDCSYLSITDRAGCLRELTVVESEISDLRGLDIITEDGLTGLGSAIAPFGLSLGAVQGLVPIARDINSWWPDRKLALLHEFFKMPDLATRLSPPSGRFIPRIRETIRPREIRTYFDRFMEPAELIPHSPLERWLTQGGEFPSGEDFDGLAKAIALRQWSEGVDFRALINFGTRSLEQKVRNSDSKRRELAAFYYLTLGQLGDTAEMVTAVLGALRRLFEQVNIDRAPQLTAQCARELWIWEQCVRYGVGREMVLLPLIMSLATNERLRRRTIFELYKAIGSPVDARSWRAWVGKPAPLGTRQRVWDAFQAGLLWWRDEAADWQVSAREPDMVRRALEELVSVPSPVEQVSTRDASGPVQSRFTPSILSRPREAQHAMAKTDPSRTARAMPNVAVPPRIARTLGMLQAEAQERISACKGRRDRFLSLLQSELVRAPLLGKVRAISSQGSSLKPIWLVGVGVHIIPVAVWLGDLHLKNLDGFRRAGAGTEPLLIVEGAVAPEIVAPPRGIRTIVRASPLFALNRWAGQRPNDLGALVAVMTARTGILRSAVEALAAIGDSQ
jgi:hypothetical protein